MSRVKAAGANANAVDEGDHEAPATVGHGCCLIWRREMELSMYNTSVSKVLVANINKSIPLMKEGQVSSYSRMVRIL